MTFVSIVMSPPRVIGPVIDTAAPESSEVEIFPFNVTPSLPVIVTDLISGVPAVIAPTVTFAAVPSESVPAFRTMMSASVPLIAANVIPEPLLLTVNVEGLLALPLVSINTLPPAKVMAASDAVKTGSCPVNLILSPPDADV